MESYQHLVYVKDFDPTEKSSRVIARNSGIHSPVLAMIGE